MVSVLVCTRDRPESLLRTVRSLLADREELIELLIIDQSHGPETELALRTFRNDCRLRYVRSRGVGKGAALNEGLALAASRVVVCTDDDCEAPPGWSTQMRCAMDAHPTAAVVFCNVTAERYDQSTGYVPVYERRDSRLLSSLTDASAGLGIGAGMALRREAILALGGYDEMFGPGSRFGSCDDWDLSLRALLGGWRLYEAANVSIVHHGLRTHAEGRAHAMRDWIAIGALCVKPLRAGHLTGVLFASRMFVARALWPPVYDLLRLKRPRGLSRIVGFAKGFVAALRMPMDRKTMMFQPRTDAQHLAAGAPGPLRH